MVNTCGKIPSLFFQPSLQPHSGQEVQLRKKHFLFLNSHRSCPDILSFEDRHHLSSTKYLEYYHDAFNPDWKICTGGFVEKVWDFSYKRRIPPAIRDRCQHSSPLVCQDTLQKCCPMSFSSSQNESDPSLFLTEAASDKSYMNARSKIFKIKQTPLLHLKMEMFYAELGQLGAL